MPVAVNYSLIVIQKVVYLHLHHILMRKLKNQVPYRPSALVLRNTIHSPNYTVYYNKLIMHFYSNHYTTVMTQKLGRYTVSRSRSQIGSNILSFKAGT